MPGKPIEKIILIEDDPNDILIMQRAFTKLCITTPLDIINNSQEAVDLLKKLDKKQPKRTLLIIDLKMPMVSGFDLLEFRAKSKRLSTIPFIVLTSSSEPTDIARAKKLGADEYLVKPTSFNELLELVNAIKKTWL